MSEVKFPQVTVKLTGTDSNAFALMGKVTQALRKAGVPKVEQDKFMEGAMSGDYDNLLRVCMATVNVE
jgi:hypothetical protein